MRLVGTSVVFHLSPEGQRELSEIFPGPGSFPAYVADQDELGLWVRLEEGIRMEDRGVVHPVILLKWHYFSTAVREFLPEAPAVRRSAGFR